MKTFNQYMESISHEQQSVGDIRVALSKLTQEECVEFALFCAKDTEIKSKDGKRCIELVERWLHDKKSVYRTDLALAGDGALRFNEGAAACAAFAANAVSSRSAYVSYAASAASHAMRVNKSDGSKYRMFLEHMLLKTSTNLNVPVKHFISDDKNMVANIAAMLDYLEDENEDIIIQTQDGVMLNNPYYNITAKNNSELARKIAEKPFLIKWLKQIYKS